MKIETNKKGDEMKILTTQDAIDRLNDIIRMLNKNKCYESSEKLDEVRQWLGKDL